MSEPKAATILLYGAQACALMQINPDGWDVEIYRRAVSWDWRMELGLEMALQEGLIEEANVFGGAAFRLTAAGREARSKIIRMEHLTP